MANGAFPDWLSKLDAEYKRISNRITGGGYPCIYGFLKDLVLFSEADSVCVLRADEHEWKLVHEVCVMNATGDSIAESVRACVREDEFQRWLDQSRRNPENLMEKTIEIAREKRRCFIWRYNRKLWIGV